MQPTKSRSDENTIYKEYPDAAHSMDGDAGNGSGLYDNLSKEW